jgi:alkylmercury lyase
VSAEEVGRDQLDEAIAGATPTLSEREQRLALTIYRLLATGRPVTLRTAATDVGQSDDDVERTLQSWPGVFRNNGRAVVAFWGLSLYEMPHPHRLRVAGATLFAWCAWDPLFLPSIVGPMDVATDDPTTGDTIGYHIDRSGAISDLTHPAAALSFLRPDRPWDDDIVTTFCHYVRMFSDVEGARRWTAMNEGTFVISLAEAVDLGLRHVRRTFDRTLVVGRRLAVE